MITSWLDAHHIWRAHARFHQVLASILQEGDQTRDYEVKRDMLDFVPDKVMARRVTQISAVLGVDVEEESWDAMSARWITSGPECSPGTTITFSSKHASKNDSPE